MTMKTTQIILSAALLSLSFPAIINAAEVTVEVTIRTGDDDLRGGNHAYFGLTDSTGREITGKVLSGGEQGGGQSTKRLTFYLSDNTISTIQGVRIRHDGSPRSGHPFDMYDNWDLDYLKVKLYKGSDDYVLYDSTVDSSFRRRVRFTGEMRSRIFPKMICHYDSSWTYLGGDINGDGNDRDIICHNKNTGEKRVVLSGGLDLVKWQNAAHRWCSHAGATLYIADANGDGRSDLICKDSNTIWFDYAADDFYQGTDFHMQTIFCTHPGSQFLSGDVNGDRRADLVCHDDLGRLWVDYAPDFRPGGFSTDNGWCRSTVALSDANRDGRADLSCCLPNDDMIYDYADRNGRFDGVTDQVLPNECGLK